MSGKPRSSVFWLAVIVGAGLLVRLVLIAQAFGSPPETFEYDLLARNWLSGAGYVYTHLGTPYQSFYSGLLYIGLTAGLYTLFPPGYTAVLIAQAVLSALLAVVVWAIGRRIWNDRVALVAALLSIAHPGLAYYDTHKLHPLGMDALLVTLSVLTLLWARGRVGRFASFVAGLTLGVAALQRGSLLFVIPVALVCLSTS